MAQLKSLVNNLIVAVICVLSLSLNVSGAASGGVSSSDAVEYVNEGSGSELGSLETPGQNRQPKSLITPTLSFGSIFPKQNENTPTETTTNSTNPDQSSVNPSQVATSVAIVKTMLIAILGGLKAALPQAILITAIFAFLLTGIAFFVCSITDCGISPLSVRGSSPYENDILNRNSYDHDYEKFRPVYHAIDDHKYKYNQIHQNKEFYATPAN